MLERRGQIIRRLPIGVFFDSASSGGVEILDRLPRQRLRMGARKMERELVGMLECGDAVKTLERLGDGCVQEPSACLSELGVNHLLEQWMREIVVNRIDAPG